MDIKIKDKKISIFLLIILIIVTITIASIIIFQLKNQNLDNFDEKEEKYVNAIRNLQLGYLKEGVSELENINPYKLSKQYLQEASYKIGIGEYFAWNFSEAKEYLTKAIDYQDANNYINEINDIEKLVGTYKTDKYTIILSNNWNAYVFSDGIGKKSQFRIIANWKTIYIDNIFNCSYDNKYDKLIINAENIEVPKISDDTTIKDKTAIIVNGSSNTLEIGMTQDDVLNSTYGKPQHIDRGGTVWDETNKKRTEGKWDESWIYTSPANKNLETVVIEFKNGRIVGFLITLKGETSANRVTSISAN